MNYLLFIFLSLGIAFKEYVKTCGKLTYENHKIWAIKTFNIGKKICGWNLNINNITNLKEDKVLLISNHVNFIDAFALNYVLAVRYPEYHTMYVTRTQFASIPIIGKYLRNNHILVQNNIEKDLVNMRKRIDELTNKHKKTILVLFPEGTLMDSTSREKSIKWCDKLGINHYQNVLAPRTTGLYHILREYQPSQVIQSIFRYDDDVDFMCGNEYYHFLNNNFPTEINIAFNCVNEKFNVKNKELFAKQFYKYWKSNVDY